MIARTTNNIGNLLYTQKKFGAAIEYYEEAIEGGREVGEMILESVAMANVAFCYGKMDSLEKGKAYFQEVYDFNLDNEVLFVHGQVCAEFADLKISLGDLEGAKKLLEESLARSGEVSDSTTIGNAWSIYARVFMEERKPQQAIAYLEKALDIAERYEDPELGIKAGKTLSDIYRQEGEMELALNSFQAYITLRDSVYAKEKSQQLAELTSILQTERKQLELDQLKAEKEFQDHVVGQQRRFISGLAVAFGVALVMLVIVVVGERRRRRTNQSLAERNAFIAAQKQEIEAQNITLEAKNQEIESLIEIVAHDLKAPISKTKALLDMVDRGATDPQTNTYLDMAEKVLGNSEELIRDILIIRNLEQESGLLKTIPVDLVGLLKETAQAYLGTSEAKEIRLVHQLPANTPLVTTNAQAVQRIVENLLSNAIKFSPAGTEVVLQLESLAGGTKISVTDQGPGISREDQARMFQKFQRLAATPTGGESSTGLGLAIAKTLAERLGGQISVESELGQGARFTLELPG